MASTFNDSAPQLQAAGAVTGRRPDQTVAGCLVFDERPPTPEHLKKYRKLEKSQPGIRVKHWGVADDALKPADYTFGVSYNSRTLDNDPLGLHEPSRVEEFLHERSEGIYESRKKEPLGSAALRGHVLPDKTSRPDFAFGVASNSTERAAPLVTPGADSVLVGDKDPQIRSLYKKSHSSYDPGEQMKRAYNWPQGMDPERMAFGQAKVSKDEPVDGVRKALNPNAQFESGVMPTQVMNKKVRDHQEVANDLLGKTKNLGLGERGVDDTFVFGMPSAKQADWDAADCIRGDYDENDQLPDRDVGTCIRRGAAPESVLSDPLRTYGTPSVRNDIPAPKMRSVTDVQNYGDEPTAMRLLFPTPFSGKGVDDNDFVQPRSDDELRKLFKIAGLSQEGASGQLDRAIEAAKDANGGQNVSVLQVRDALIKLR